MKEWLAVRIQTTKQAANLSVNLETRHLVSASGGWVKLMRHYRSMQFFCVAAADSHCDPAFNFLGHHFCRNAVAVVQRRQRACVEKSVWQADLAKGGGNA